MGLYVVLAITQYVQLDERASAVSLLSAFICPLFAPGTPSTLIELGCELACYLSIRLTVLAIMYQIIAPLLHSGPISHGKITCRKCVILRRVSVLPVGFGISYFVHLLGTLWVSVSELGNGEEDRSTMDKKEDGLNLVSTYRR